MVNPGERISNVHCTDDELLVSLADGRSISAPLAWYWKIAGAGFGIHWPSLDEYLSVAGLFRGAPAPRQVIFIV